MLSVVMLNKNCVYVLRCVTLRGSVLRLGEVPCVKRIGLTLSVGMYPGTWSYVLAYVTLLWVHVPGHKGERGCACADKWG
jgi:hypothetical protein